jgi:hypothetical protein
MASGSSPAPRLGLAARPRLDPGDPTTHHRYARLLALRCRVDASLRENGTAQGLGPPAPTIGAALGFDLVHARGCDEAITAARSALALEAGSPPAHTVRGLAHQLQGHHAQAIVDSRRHVELSVQDPNALMRLGRNCAAFGQPTRRARSSRDCASAPAWPVGRQASWPPSNSPSGMSSRSCCRCIKACSRARRRSRPWPPSRPSRGCKRDSRFVHLLRPIGSARDPASGPLRLSDHMPAAPGKRIPARAVENTAQPPCGVCRMARRFVTITVAVRAR